MRGVLAAAIYFAALVIVCAAYSGAGKAADPKDTSPRTSSGVTERGTREPSSSPKRETAMGQLASPRSVTSVIRHVFRRHAAEALRVARCESNLRPRALGAAGERGLFQIHPVHFGWLDERRLWQPLYNARIAYRMSQGGRDWGAWTCRP